MQGVRHRVHPGDADRHLHGVTGRCLRRVLQLRPDEPPASTRSPRAEGDQQVTTESTGWIAEALREHKEHDHDERAAAAPGEREQQVLDRIDRARRRRPKVREERITMSHGAGGKGTQTLIGAVFPDASPTPELEQREDPPRLRIAGAKLAFTTDSYV